MLRFIDGADHYATGDITEKWTARAGAVQVSAATGRRGSASLRFSAGGIVTTTLDAQATWTLGFAWRCEHHPGSASRLCALQDSGTTQLDVRMQPGGTMTVTRGGTILGTSAQALHEGAYYYLELRAVIDQTAGAYTFRVDGVTWLEAAGVDTQVTGNASANMVLVGHFGDGLFGNVDIDDLYLCDGQGSGTFTTFLGDCRVDALLPNADGTHTAWSPSAGTAHYATVDEPAPNDDTDYVSETTAGGRDSYQLEPLPTMPNPEVLAVQALLSVRKEDVDEILIKPLLVSGAVTSVASAAHALTASYLYARDLWTADPNGGGAWTEASVNSLQVGVERLA